MQFNRDPLSPATIRSVERGQLVIGDREIDSTVALTTRGVVDDWQETPLTALSVDGLSDILADRPDVIIIGYGWTSARPPNELTFALARRGIGLEVMDTPAACRTFNILLAEDRRPAALLYLGS
ncbi:MAG: MTH938/NDUFAF3 family protein [Pseudomonadota bacterium]